jgi:hypothetical protein
MRGKGYIPDEGRDVLHLWMELTLANLTMIGVLVARIKGPHTA